MTAFGRSLLAEKPISSSTIGIDCSRAETTDTTLQGLRIYMTEASGQQRRFRHLRVLSATGRDEDWQTGGTRV